LPARIGTLISNGFCATFRGHAHARRLKETLDVFSVRDLRTRSGDLLRDAELGQLARITKHGRPAILAVPFARRLLDQGVHRALALTLFENRHLTLAQAAKVAGLSLDAFIDLLGSLGLAAVDDPAEALADELGGGL
jgi:prevent-host-death family protein